MKFKSLKIISFTSSSVSENKSGIPFLTLENVLYFDFFEKEKKAPKLSFNTIVGNLIFSNGRIFKVEDDNILEQIKQKFEEYSIPMIKEIDYSLVHSDYKDDWSLLGSERLSYLQDYADRSTNEIKIEYAEFAIPEKYFTDYKILLNESVSLDHLPDDYINISKIFSNMEYKDKIIPHYMDIYNALTYVDFINKKVFIPFSLGHLVSQELKNIEGEDCIIIYMGSGRIIYSSEGDTEMLDSLTEDEFDKIFSIFKYSSSLFLKISKNNDETLNFNNLNFIVAYSEGKYRKYNTERTLKAIEQGECF